MSVFSITYNARKQIMFEKALKEKDSTKAKQILESFPKGQNNSEKIEYLIVLNEGYRAIIENYQSFGEYRDLECQLSELEDLRESVKRLDRL